MCLLSRGGNGNPLQHSCLENPRDGGAWWAAVYRVTQSQTRLNWLSRQHIKKQRHYFASRCPSSPGYDFSSGCVWMWELDCKESWTPKNWCFWTVVLGKTLESPLDSKEIQPVLPKGNQSWIFTGRTDAEAEAPILWLPDVKNWVLGKDPDAGKDWGQGAEGDDRGWDGWMALPTLWTLVWASSGLFKGQLHICTHTHSET